MYENFQLQVLMSYLVADIIVQRIKENKIKGANQYQTNKGEKNTWKNVNKNYVFNLQPDNLQAFAHPLQWWFESSYRTRKHWKQSGKGTEPIPWSPIIRCARPWRETRAQSAINKGAWEGRVVTVTKMFSDRHLVSYETCLYHRGKSKSILSTPGWNALGQRVIELQFKQLHMLHRVFLLCISWNIQEHKSMT